MWEISHILIAQAVKDLYETEWADGIEGPVIQLGTGHRTFALLFLNCHEELYKKLV